MNKHSIHLVQRSWAQVTPIAPQAADIFYERLFALDPGLTPAQVVELMKQGATPREGDASFLLIHPQQSVELLKKRAAAAG